MQTQLHYPKLVFDCIVTSGYFMVQNNMLLASDSLYGLPFGVDRLQVRMLGYAICAALMEKEAPMLVMDELSLRAAKGVREIKDVIVKPPRPDPWNKRKRTPLAVLQNTLEHGAGTLNDPIVLD